MYLLMLLATYVSIIYGYNLSPRPEYDRDVATKKAAAVIYKFNTQHVTIKSILSRIVYNIGTVSYNVEWIYSEDLLYNPFGEGYEYVIRLNQSKTVEQGAENDFYVRYDENEDISENILPIGHSLSDSSEMSTKILCLDDHMHEETVDHCDNSEYEYVCNDGTTDYTCYTGSCCTSSSYTYVMSYKKVDPRWINRVTGEIGLDMWSAITSKEYSDNIGIITWDGSNWIFRGKIAFYPIYAKEQIEYESDGVSNYPINSKRRTYWKLPNYIFDSDFFQSEDGEICQESGCIFRIQSIS